MSSALRSGAFRLAWLAFAALLLQQCIDAWLRDAPWFIWLLKSLPLLLFLPGMIKDRLRSYIWLCFVCLGYFLVLVQRAFAEPDSLLVVSGLFAVMILFTSAMLYVRWRARELRSSSADPKNAGDSGYE